MAEANIMTPEETREYYAGLVATIINGDEAKKAKLDDCATRMLVVMRTTHPTLSDKTLCSFAATTATILAQLMQVAVRDISDMLEHTFNDHLVTTAILAGAYDPTSTEVPKAPEAKPVAETPVTDEDYRPGNYL